MKPKHIFHFCDYWIDLSKVSCISETDFDVKKNEIFINVFISSSQAIKILLPSLDKIDKNVYDELCDNVSKFKWFSLDKIANDRKHLIKLLSTYNSYVYSSLIHHWITYDSEI